MVADSSLYSGYDVFFTTMTGHADKGSGTMPRLRLSHIAGKSFLRPLDQVSDKPGIITQQNTDFNIMPVFVKTPECQGLNHEGCIGSHHCKIA